MQTAWKALEPSSGIDANRAVLVADKPIFNVRINDGGTISPPMNRNPLLQWPSLGASLSSPVNTVVALIVVKPPTGGEVYTLSPDAHRDFPIDVLASDQTYTIEAWAVNEDCEVISPKATLQVHPVAQSPRTLGTGAARFEDYHFAARTSGTLLTTEFTVIK